MRISSLLTLGLVPAALVAQAPATDYMSVLKAQTPAIDALLKEFKGPEALEKGMALLPPALPKFDQSSPAAAMKSSISFSGLTRLYLLNAKSAAQAGEWEKVLELCKQAQAAAQVNYDGTKAALTPVIETWTNAVEQGKKFVADNTDRIQALKAKPGRNAAEEQEFQAFLEKEKAWGAIKENNRQKSELATWLQAHVTRQHELEAKAITPQEQEEIKGFEVAQKNAEQGPKTIKALQDNIDATKAELDSCAPKIEATTKNLKDEADETAKGLAEFKVNGKPVKETSGPKFEEKKSKYYESILTTKSNYENRPNKIDKMNFLFRLRHNVAGTALQAKVDETIARVKNDQDPLPAKGAKAAKPAKGGKKTK